MRQFYIILAAILAFSASAFGVTCTGTVVAPVIACTQQANVSSGTVVTIPATGSGHSLNIGLGYFNNASVGTWTITDSASESLTVTTELSPTASKIRFATLSPVASGVTTVTFSFTSTGSIPVVYIQEVSGLSSVIDLAAVVTQPASGTTITTSSFTLANTDFVMAMFYDWNGSEATFTAGPNFTLGGSTSGQAVVSSAMEYWANASPQTTTASFTLNTASSSGSFAVIGIKNAAVSAGYSVTGASSGNLAFPSGNITWTKTTGTWNGSCQLIVSDGGQGGTWGGSMAGTSTGTFTPTNGASTFNATYNAAVTGAITFTYSSAASCAGTDPSPSTYTSTVLVITSQAVGGWHTTSTWAGGVVPINKTQVIIADATQVTCEVGQTCTAGISGANDTTAITIGQAGVATSTAKLINNGTLIVHGDILANPQVGAKTVGYFALTLNAGSTLQFDSSTATSPATTKYYFAPAAGSDQDALVLGNGTANAGDSTGITSGGNHVTITSNGGGGNGYFKTSGDATAPWNHSFTFTDFVNIGDTANNAVSVSGFSPQTSSSIIFNNVTFTGSGPVSMGLLNSANTNWSFTHVVWKNSQQNFCVKWGAPNPSATQLFDQLWCDKGMQTSSGTANWNGITFTHSVAGLSYTIAGTAAVWANFSHDLIILDYVLDSGGGEQTFSGPASYVYMLWHADIAHKHWMVPGSSATATYDHFVFESDGSNATCSGSDIMLTGASGAAPGIDYPLINSLSMPPATSGCSTGSILQPLSTAPNHYTLGAVHNTAYAQQGITTENNDSFAPYVSAIRYNIFYFPPGSGGGPAYKLVDGFSSCIQDQVPPAAADYNASWNITSLDPTPPCGFTNQGRGYWAKWSVTPGAHDLADQNPGFADRSRNLMTFDNAYLGNANGAPWSAGTSYNVGQITTHPLAGYYGGATINWKCIQSYTAGALNSEPGVSATDGVNWRAFWEPATFDDFRNALYSGKTFGGQNIIDALINWAERGYAPQNPNLWKIIPADGKDSGAIDLPLTQHIPPFSPVI